MKLFKASASFSPILASDAFDPASNYLLLVKGAPDILIQRCSSILGANGQALPLQGEVLDALTSYQRQMASEGQRVLLLARRILTAAQITPEALASRFVMADATMAANEDLQVVGLVGLLDPPRHDTAETVRVCRGAGIRFFMVSGKIYCPVR